MMGVKDVIVKMIDGEEIIIHEAKDYYTTPNHWVVDVSNTSVSFNKSVVKYIGWAGILKGDMND